jgi:hypothetical protein
MLHLNLCLIIEFQLGSYALFCVSPWWLTLFPSKWSPGIPPLCRISSSLKRGEGLSKVTVGRVFHSFSTIMHWVGIFPSYNLCDNKTNRVLIHRSM